MMLVLFGDKVLVLYLVKVAPSDAAVLAADAPGDNVTRYLAFLSPIHPRLHLPKTAWH